jgi:hypothetical protein
LQIEKLNPWLAVVANLGMIVGIVFLAVEIRTNTAAVQSSSVQAVTNTSVEGLRALASDADLSRIRRTGDAQLSALTEDERYRYFLYYRNFWLTFQNNFFQRYFGVLDAGIWNTYARIICKDIGTPGIRATWPDHAEVLDPEFVRLVESCPSFK